MRRFRLGWTAVVGIAIGELLQLWAHDHLSDQARTISRGIVAVAILTLLLAIRFRMRAKAKNIIGTGVC